MALQLPLQPLQLVEARRGAGSVGPARTNPRTSIKEYSSMDVNIRKYSSTFISIREIAMDLSIEWQQTVNCVTVEAVNLIFVIFQVAR